MRKVIIERGKFCRKGEGEETAFIAGSSTIACNFFFFFLPENIQNLKFTHNSPFQQVGFSDN